MRNAVGLLYLVTALVGLYWSVNLTLTGLYGAPFSRWYVVVFIGAVLLLIGAILWWTSSRKWTRWVPLIGSLFLSAYFIPGFVTLVRQGRVDVTRVLIFALVIASLVVAVVFRHVGSHPQLPTYR